MMFGIGHNSGQVITQGHSWRKHVWTRARADLLPKLPIEVVRLRVKRAAALGLPYMTYAGVRASTGHDLVGFLFSSNALGVVRAGQVVPAKLADLTDCDRVALVHGAETLAALQAVDDLDAAYPAPQFTQSWSEMRDHLKTVMRRHGVAADRYLMVGDTAFEREWADAAQTAGYMNAATFFDPAPTPA